MKITYIDSGVLLSATDGVSRIAEKALEVLGDSNRKFASSQFVKLEVNPKAIYHKQTTTKLILLTLGIYKIVANFCLLRLTYLSYHLSYWQAIACAI